MKRKKILKEKEEINRMINEGLGAGQIIEEVDKVKFALPDIQKAESNNELTNGSMASTIEEMKKLGKEMEEIDTETELRQKGLQPDPPQ